MFEENIKKVITPLINKSWDKNNKEIVDKLKEILFDSIYSKCLYKISPTYCETIINNLATSLEFKKYDKNEILLKYNEPINKFYFIFKGKLNAYKVSMEKAEKSIELYSYEYYYDKEEVFQYFQTFLKKYLKAINTENIFMNNYKNIYNLEEEIEEKKNKRAKKYEELFKKIINDTKELDYSLTEGKTFGEEFLYNIMPFSNCILECGSDCILGELDRDDYDKIFKRFNKIERSYITVFLVNLKQFSPANYFFSKFQQCLIKRYYSKNEIIFKQGEKFRAFYLVRNGKVNLSLKIQKTVNCELEPDIIMGKLKKERFTSNKSYITKGKYSEFTDYNLITLQNGEFIGDIEFQVRNDKYLSTAICEDDSVVFEIDIELFDHFIINNHNVKDNLKGFYENIKEKKRLLQERIYDIKMNYSAIKKTDYILSKNKFTKNILLGHPLKEDQKDDKSNSLYNNKKSSKKKNKKIDNSDNFYLEMISPFLKRYSSASKSKKFNKIKFNKNFFNNRNDKETFMNHKKNIKLKEIISNSNYSVGKINSSNRVLTETNEPQSTNRTQMRNINLLLEQSGSKRKNNNILFPFKSTNIPSIIPLNNFRKKNTSKIFLKQNNTAHENEKLYDFMDANLIFSNNDKSKKKIIPKILKSTKESKIYEQRYSKEIISKINDYYFKPSKKKIIN